MKILLNKIWAMRHYTLIAAAGWMIDNSLYLSLYYLAHVPVFISANIGILCGSAFAYVFATRHVFSGASWAKWWIYIAYTFVTTEIWSGLITFLVHAGLWPLVAKLVIVPLTFYTNYLFLGWLQRGRVQWLG